MTFVSIYVLNINKHRSKLINYKSDVTDKDRSN